MNYEKLIYLKRSLELVLYVYYVLTVNKALN